MSSPARSLAPRLEAVALRLLACVAFLVCVRVEQVARAADTGLQASEARQHDDAPAADDLSAAEPESPETDATLETPGFRMCPCVRPVVRFVRASPPVVRVLGWRPQPMRWVAMAQGPP